MTSTLCLFVGLCIHYVHAIDSAQSDPVHYTCDCYEWLAHPTCPNIVCDISVFQYCKAASIGNLFDEYLTKLGFHYPGEIKSDPNTLVKISLEPDTTSKFCSGLFVRRHLLSLMHSQDINRTGVAIDLTSLLEKTELHKAVNGLPFWPTSYHLGIKKQRRGFFESLSCNTKLEMPLVFKNNEHKGTGIVFLDDTEVIRKLFLTNNDLKYALKHKKSQLFIGCDPNKAVERLSVRQILALGFMRKDIDRIARIIKRENFIVQEYVSNTLLVDGRKNALRVFVVVLSMNPFVVMYSEGYASINVEDFDSSKIRKSNVLSNREVSAKVDGVETEWNWSFDQLGEYLEKREDVTFGIEHVRRDLMMATNDTLNAIVRENGRYSKNTRKKQDYYVPLGLQRGVLDRKKDNNYMWLSLDYLLTNEGEVKLMEWNLHPGTRYLDHCSWNNVTDPRYEDWQCQQGRNITKEICDASFEMAYRKKEHLPFIKEEELRNMISYHQLLVFREFGRIWLSTNTQHDEL